MAHRSSIHRSRREAGSRLEDLGGVGAAGPREPVGEPTGSGVGLNDDDPSAGRAERLDLFGKALACVTGREPPSGTSHRRRDDHEFGLDLRREVCVCGRGDASVDIRNLIDDVRLEHPWDGRRGLSCPMHVDVMTIAPEHHDVPRCGRYRGYPQSVGPLGVVLHTGEAGEPSRWEDAGWKQAGDTQQAGAVLVSGMLDEARCKRSEGFAGIPQLVPHPSPVAFARRARDNFGEVLRFDSSSDRRTDRRAGGRSDDQLNVVRASLQLAFDSMEHAGMEYPAVGSTGAKYESDSFSHRALNHGSGSLIPDRGGLGNLFASAMTLTIKGG